MNKLWLATAWILTQALYAQQTPSIVVNQLGYRPGDKKMVLLRNNSAVAFEVRHVQTNKSVFRGKIRPVGMRDENTGDELFQIDFSGLQEPGVYQVWIPANDELSPEFKISPDVYREAAIISLQSFYYQRCGIEVNNGSLWKHPVCHTRDAFLYHTPSTVKDVTGGWHDAGDYGKFVATGIVSAAWLLYLYEHQPSSFFDGQLLIPETNNGVPDLLDEVRWELEWLLKMQRDDGAVYHKVSTKKWTGEYLPHRDLDKRYLFDVSSTATGAFAAVMALSARLYQTWDPRFAQRLLQAAVAAWKFLEDHPTIIPPGGFRNPPDTEGGEYGDVKDEDERLWAAVELYRTTGHKKYHQYFLDTYRSVGGLNYPISWQQVQNFAYYSYLKLPPSATNQQARAYLIGTMTIYCDNLVRRIEANGYRYSLTRDQYYWGSNSVALGHAFDLVQGFELTKRSQYLDAALDQLHHFLGRNAFGQTFMTGVGSNPVRWPYHQFSMMLRAGKPVPGLAVGGPNKNGRLRGRVLSDFPGKCYEDNEKNYYVNEVAINYTAPFVFLAGYFSHQGTESKRNTAAKGVK